MQSKNTKKKNWFIILLSVLTTICCFSVGFGAWEITGGDQALLSGAIDSDNYTEVDVPVKTFTISSTPSFTALAGRGFLNSNNEYVDSISLTWNITFNSNRARDFILSLSQNKMWMSVTLTASSTSSVMANFSVSNITNGLGSATTIQQNDANTYNSGTYINQQWNITSVTIANSVSFQITIPLTYTGSISNFPNLTTNKLTLTLLPGEYKNA